MFKLVTWNIQSGRGPDGKTGLDRIIACLDRFCSFDMLCVQEVSSGYAACGEDQFAMLRERLPGYTGFEVLCCVTIVPDAGDGARRRFGLMVFSRHPVPQALRHSLPWLSQPEVMSIPRSALLLTVAPAGGLPRVMAGHLEYFSRRLRGLHREASLHAACPAPPGHGPFGMPPRAMPALLAGDFNMLPGSPERQRCLGLAGRHPALARLLAAGPAGPAPRARGRPARPQAGRRHSLHLRLRVRQRRPGRARAPRAGGRQRTGSDHQALMVELAWGG